MTQTTKRALEESLKNLLLTKPFPKITIQDIADDCGISRMTFYYHFKDIYDLVEWACMEDAQKALGENGHYDSWQVGLLHIFEAVQDNKPFILNVYHSVSREQVENYIYQITHPLILSIIDEKACEFHIRDAEKQFIVDFYKYALVGFLLDWIKKNMKEDPKEIIARLSVLIHGHLLTTLQHYKKRSS